MDLTTIILAALLALAPHDRQRPPKGWEETEDAYRSRLASIAADIATASGGNRERAVKLIGVAWHESGFAPDVDAGQCANEAKGRCDGGKAKSIFQLQERDATKRETYRTNRLEAAREALRRIERSERACGGGAEAYAAYAGGVCSLLSAKAASRSLWASVERARRVMR